MSTLHTRLSDALKDALRANHSLRKRTLRGALASIKQAEVDSLLPDGQTELPETGIAILLQMEVRAHQVTIADAERAGRDDLVSEMRERISILEEFLPKQLSRDEISTLAKTVIIKVGADSQRHMGEVMKRLMPQLYGQAEGKLVSSVVSELLTRKGR